MPPSPWLVCVELRAERVTPGSAFHAPAAPDILGRLHTLLARARSGAWEIVHVQSHARQGTGGPIDGLEPLADEPVFRVPSCSAFDSATLLKRARLRAHAALYFMGFAAGEIILPSVMAAAELGLRPIVVEDAIASSHNEEWQASDVVGLVTQRLGPMAARKTEILLAAPNASDVVRIEDFRREVERG